MSADLPYQPVPVFLGDTEGSTLAVMLFPDDMKAARHWHAKYLAQGVLPAYRAAGHDFTPSRWTSYVSAVAEGEAEQKQVERRLLMGELAAQVAFDLWTSISLAENSASWRKSILAVAKRARRSETHVRDQLNLFGPVLHLWLAWLVDGRKVVPAPELFPLAYALLFRLRQWEGSRNPAFRPENRCLSVREFGPWPELAREMEGAEFEMPIALAQGV